MFIIQALVRVLLSLNEPRVVVRNGFIYIGVYYVMAAFFHHYAKRSSDTGIWARFWRKGGFLDVVSSGLWLLSAGFLSLALLDLLRTGLTLRYIIAYYILFIFLFAFIYNLLEWNFGGMVDSMKAGWIGEIQCVTMSIQVMTGGYHTSAKPASPWVEAIAGVQAVLGVMFVAVFVARAVVTFAPPQ